MHNEIKWICLIINCEVDIRAFVLARAKMYLYFNIRTYFLYFIYSLFKITYIKLSILHYISLKYHFS